MNEIVEDVQEEDDVLLHNSSETQTSLRTNLIVGRCQEKLFRGKQLKQGHEFGSQRLRF